MSVHGKPDSYEFSWLKSLLAVATTGAIVIGAAALFLWFSRGIAADVVIDSSVHATASTHNGTTLTVVFTSDQVGYAFFRDSSGACAYHKTTDGGVSWGGTVTVDSQTDCLRVAVWYDRWTPGNTTGTMIHISTIDSGTDDIWYTRLDTSDDTLSTTLSAAGTNQGGTFTAGANLNAITVGTNGIVYMGILDGADSYMLRCMGSCTATTTNWTEAGTGTSVFPLANDWLLLAPISGSNGDILAVRFDIGLDDVVSKVWHATSSSWDANWTNIDTACQNNTTYDGHFGITLNKINGNIFLAYACDVGTIGGNNDDIRTAIYSSGAWSAGGNVLTNTTYGITGVKIGLDINTGNLYAVYSARTTGGTASTTNVYFKISTSTTMASWGTEQGPVNTTSTDIYGLRLDGLNNERIYATWVDGIRDDLLGETIADLTVTTYSQSAYRFFTNADSASPGPPLAGTSLSALAPDGNSQFRLRLLIHAGGSGADIGRDNFKLQVATSTPGNCTSSLGNFVDVTTSTGEIQFFDNPSVADATSLTATSTDPTHGTDTVVNETYEEANTFTNSVAKILGGQDGKWDFSLRASTAPALSTYCFRAVLSDGTLLDGYSATPEITINDPPVLGAIQLNGGADIALIESTFRTVSATSTVTDQNGALDIIRVTGRLFRSGAGSSCAANDNNCYTNNNCSLSSCAGNSCTATCTFNVFYHADPTDTGTTHAAENWLSTMIATDAQNATSSATSSPVEMLSLLAIQSTSPVNYGNLSPGASVDPLSRTTVLSNKGNVSLDTSVSGINMTSGGNSISVGQQRFATSSLAYVAGQSLATSTFFMDLNIPKTTASSTPATSTVFWGIQVPNPQATGNYTGNNTFIGITNALPWP